MNTRLKVSETMDHDPLVLSGAITVFEAARRMRDRGVGSFLVYDEGLSGIVTERDILHKVVAEGQAADQIPVRAIMSDRIVTITPRADILEALRLMRQCRIRRLPVLEGGRLAGLLTERHISQVAPELLQIADDWDRITNGDGHRDGHSDGHRMILEEETFIPGRCEACGNEDVDLHEQDGGLLCEECLEAQEPEIRLA